MRDDVLVDVVLQRCEALKRSGFWPSQEGIRPRQWLNNFEDQDKKIAALLLDRFVLCNEETTDSLLITAWNSIADGSRKSREYIPAEQLRESLHNAVFTPVEGEAPNPTDSGNFMCRKARQVLGVDEARIKRPEEALACAGAGTTVVFLDDFVGSGDQFISSWERNYAGSSFRQVKSRNDFVAIYLTLVTTEKGLGRIYASAPNVALCPAHILSNRSTVYGLVEDGVFDRVELYRFLRKYSCKLRPEEDYIANNHEFLTFGYRNLGLFMGFRHSIPDATLPIFWAPGINGWEPLIDRL